MGHWVNCEKCAGSGTVPCSCLGEGTCLVCNGTGRMGCSSCHGCGLVYQIDEAVEDDYEFVYDEY